MKVTVSAVQGSEVGSGLELALQAETLNSSTEDVSCPRTPGLKETEPGYLPRV